MFVVIYQGYIKPGREAEYQRLWHKIVCYFKAHRGAIGSCLHQTENGMWVAYSRWPDKATRDASWPEDMPASDELCEEIQRSIIAMKDCLDPNRQLPDIHMTVIDDLL